ncbi:MAG: hypothetical protein ABIQ11_10920 [Saprospiraceae bacterium]
MVLSEKLRNYIVSPAGILIGTRDAALKPEFQRAMGARPAEDHHIQFFFDLKTSGRTIDNIQDNQSVSIVLCHLLTMESFQFKGRSIGYRECSPEELNFVDEYYKKFNEAAIQFGMKDGLCYNYPHSQMWSMLMEVEEVFEQTPKIGTGQKV